MQGDSSFDSLRSTRLCLHEYLGVVGPQVLNKFISRSHKATYIPAISASPIVSPPKNFFFLSSLSRISRSSQTSSFPFSCSKPLVNTAFSDAETSHGSLVGMFGQNGSAGKGVVDILQNEERLRDWVSVVQKHRDFFVDRVGFEKQGGLVEQILF
nr:uncharacterized protein LOC8066117 [Ipomoea trifida]